MSTRTAVMSFGDGTHGALGLPSSLVGPGIGGEDAYEPTKVPGLPSDVTSVNAGHYHSLAVTSQGKLWAWGRNHECQLGRGPSSPRSVPFSPNYALNEKSVIGAQISINNLGIKYLYP